MTSPHLDPDPRRQREFRPDDEWVDPRHGGEVPFLVHLEALRRVLQHSVAAIAVAMIAGWWLSPRVLQDLLARTVHHAVVLSPFEAFNERIKLSFVLAFGMALPVVLWRVWSFVVPALFKQERRWVMPLVLGSYVLFGLGSAAAYGYVIPLVIRVLEQFLVPGLTEQIRLSSLLDFTYNLAIACGLLAQLPIVTMLLTGVGLVTPGFLARQWRVAIVVIFLVTAFITPGDVISAQLVMGVPMILLYFASVGLSFLVARKRDGAEDSTATVEPGGEDDAQS